MDDQFLDMNDEDIDNLLFGINISDEKPVNDTICISCKSENMVLDEKMHIKLVIDKIIDLTYKYITILFYFHNLFFYILCNLG